MSVPFRLRDDLYSRRMQLFQQAVEIADRRLIITCVSAGK